MAETTTTTDLRIGFCGECGEYGIAYPPALIEKLDRCHDPLPDGVPIPDLRSDINAFLMRYSDCPDCEATLDDDPRRGHAPECVIDRALMALQLLDAAATAMANPNTHVDKLEEIASRIRKVLPS